MFRRGSQGEKKKYWNKIDRESGKVKGEKAELKKRGNQKAFLKKAKFTNWGLRAAPGQKRTSRHRGKEVTGFTQEEIVSARGSSSS